MSKHECGMQQAVGVAGTFTIDNDEERMVQVLPYTSM